MQRKTIVIMITCAILIAGGIVYAADHMDAPAVKGQTTDITDLYVFQGKNTDNMVFVGNSQGLLAPSATGAASFDPNTLIQFKIDNNGDNVEDLVIQAIYKDGKVNFFGLGRPPLTGTRTKIAEANFLGSVDVTPYGASHPIVGYGSYGIKFFAGPRDDPFFFDLDQFHAILGGTATGFNNPGKDTFAGTNVLSIVVEVPKSLLHAQNGKLGVWLTTSSQEGGSAM
ncbi:MAG: DUF4331 family protein [Bacteroidota bacterium]|nr:DUF4331 family protein [Bacteroidota bacterium]MDP4260285.1 DUF4331 family protein [Bacteroidota bacterium]